MIPSGNEFENALDTLGRVHRASSAVPHRVHVCKRANCLCPAELTAHPRFRLGAMVDAFLEEIDEFRPGEAWSDCAGCVEKQDPELAA